MDLSNILNPSVSKHLNHQQIFHPHQSRYRNQQHHQYQYNFDNEEKCLHPPQVLNSPPLSPKNVEPSVISNMKPRSRFSVLEDAIICQGVANGLTWGQISGQLPHRKRATCFNRYRTLQGIRKSRPHSAFTLPPTSAFLSTYSQAHDYHPYRQHDARHHHHYHHHHRQHQRRYSYSSQWLLSSPPPAPPALVNDIPSSFESGFTRRESTCSSILSSPLPSPSLLHMEQWHPYHYSRRASNSTAISTLSSSTSCSSPQQHSL